MFDRLIPYVRIMLGLVYAINGLNWFFKIITPYPSISDFVDFMPPPDIVGALIEQGLMFHAAKAIELMAGILLLANRAVPLTLVVSMAVTVPVFMVDVWKPELRLRSTLMGTGSMVMNTVLLMAYYQYFRPMLNWRAAPTSQPAVEAVAQPDGVAAAVGGISQLLLRPLLVLGALLGTAQVIWLAVMIAQYVADPKAIYEVREMVPRVAEGDVDSSA